MTSETALRAISLALFVICFGSFIWGMTRFFRMPAHIPPGVRVVQCLGSIVSLLHLFLLSFSRYPQVAPVIVAAILYVFALVLFWSAIRIHSRRPPAACYIPDSPEHLVVSGPYRLVRHPFYTAYMLAWLAGAIATQQPWLLLSLALMSVLYIRAAFHEERQFQSSALASQWDSYRNKTGMFLPRIT